MIDGCLVPEMCFISLMLFFMLFSVSAWFFVCLWICGVCRRVVVGCRSIGANVVFRSTWLPSYCRRCCGRVIAVAVVVVFVHFWCFMHVHRAFCCSLLVLQV